MRPKGTCRTADEVMNSLEGSLQEGNLRKWGKTTCGPGEKPDFKEKDASASRKGKKKVRASNLWGSGECRAWIPCKGGKRKNIRFGSRRKTFSMETEGGKRRQSLTTFGGIGFRSKKMAKVRDGKCGGASERSSKRKSPEGWRVIKEHRQGKTHISSRCWKEEEGGKRGFMGENQSCKREVRLG